MKYVIAIVASAAALMVGADAEANQYNTSYCREYNQTIYIGGRAEAGYGSACQQPDGSWRVVSGGAYGAHIEERYIVQPVQPVYYPQPVYYHPPAPVYRTVHYRDSYYRQRPVNSIHLSFGNSRPVVYKHKSHGRHGYAKSHYNRGRHNHRR